jgi:maltose-binding protein MalE
VKKLMMLAALLAIAVVAAVPALAQVSQETEQEPESGDATQNFSVTGGGDNSSSCQMVQGITNTGNATNQTSVLQYANSDAEFEQDDSGNFEISPTQNENVPKVCDQQVNQAASATG